MSAQAAIRESLVADLRQQMAQLEGSRRPEEDEPLSTGCRELDRLLPRGGFLRGTLVEWLAGQSGSGAGTLALLTARQACCQGRALVVMDRQRSFYPPAAVAWGYGLEQMLVIQSVREEDELWALDQVLRCRGVGAVYAPLTRLDVHDFRRLQLAAECGGTLGLFLRPATVRGDPSWADLQLAVCPRGSPVGRKLCVEIIRCRGGTAGRSIELEITNSGMVQTVSMSHASRETNSLYPVAELARATIADCGLQNKNSFQSAIRNLQSAILLHSRDPRRGNCVVAYSPEAEAWGVRIGMPLAEASSLAQRGGRFVALAHNPAADLAELTRLAELCERFSPLVGWETVDPFTDWWPATGPAHLFLDITGIGRLFDGEERLIAEVRREFAREGYEIQATAAETIGAAWGQLQIEDCSLKKEGPQSAICNPQSTILLRLPSATLSLLAQLGITRVDELLRLPRESLRSRFGERLLLRLDQLSGAAQETIVPHHPPPRFQAEWILEYPTDSRELVEQMVSQLLGRIATDLAERQEGVIQLACRLDGSGGRPLQLSVGLFRPSAQRQHLEALVRMQLEQSQLPRQIGRIGIAAQLTAPLENRQTELFADSSREASHDFALLVDRLASRLGPAAVLQPLLRADPLPERAVSYVPVVGKKKRRQRRKAQIPDPKSEIPNPKSEIAFRPLLLHHPPLPLAAISVVPNGPPASFDFQGQTHRIDRHWGPERIETGWWRGRSHRRDYYRVETATGHRYWLFRRLADGKWHLHGEYA